MVLVFVAGSDLGSLSIARLRTARTVTLTFITVGLEALR